MVTGPRAVLADDHAITRVGIRHALERAGVSVVDEADTAAGAVRAVRRRRPDVCLVDMHLSGSGVTVARELATIAPATRVIVLLESEAAEELLAALRAGATGCLVKDIDPAALGRAVRATLDGEGLLPRSLTACVIEELRCRAGELRLRSAEGAWVTLSGRESEVLRLMQRHLTTKQIAECLGISAVTVRRHVSAAARRLGVGDRDGILRLTGVRDGAPSARRAPS